MLAKEDLMLQERKNEVAEITKTNVRKANDGNKGVHRLVSGVLSKDHEQGVVLQVVDTRDGRNKPGRQGRFFYSNFPTPLGVRSPVHVMGSLLNMISGIASW